MYFQNTSPRRVESYHGFSVNIERDALRKVVPNLGAGSSKWGRRPTTSAATCNRSDKWCEMGPSENVALTVAGRQSGSGFDRYDIPSEVNLADAVAKMEERNQQRNATLLSAKLQSSYNASENRAVAKGSILHYPFVALVPGGGVEPPRAEAPRILSVMLHFCKS